MTGKRISDYEAWPISGVKPTPAVLSVLARIYGTTVEELTDGHDRQMFTEKERIALATFTDHQRDNITELSGKHIDEMNLDQLRGNVVKLAKLSESKGFLQILPELLYMRNRISKMLASRHHPRLTSDLHFLAGAVCGMLSDASDCFDNKVSAMKYAQATLRHGELAGHNSLIVWSRTMQASLVQNNRPQQALDFLQLGRSFAHSTPTRTWLYSSQGQIFSLMGDNSHAAGAFLSAQENLEKGLITDELFNEIGGTFHFSPARLHRAMAGGYLQTELAPKATRAAQMGLEVYANLENGNHSNESSLRIKLAHAHVLANDLDAATEAIKPVIDLPLNRRVAWLKDDTRRLQSALERISDRRSSTYQALHSSVEEFSNTFLKLNGIVNI